MRWAGTLLIAWILGCLGGCVDVRAFEGKWSGGIVGEEEVRQGFSEEARVDTLHLKEADLYSLQVTLSGVDGLFSDTPLQPVVKAANDALASLTFDGQPLRSYLMFAPLERDGQPQVASVVVSLFSDDHLEMRVFRGEDLFGVFNLQRLE